MTTTQLTDQTFNILAAAFGALAGLITTPQLQQDALLSAASAAGPILYLGHRKQRGATIITLCGLLGLACTRLTVCLVS